MQKLPAYGPVNEYLELLSRAYVGSLATPEPPPGLQWDLLISRLLAHRSLVTFSSMLLGSAATPPDAKTEVSRFSRLLRRRNAYLQLELARVLAALEESGTRPVVLKGPALAATTYPDPGERFFVDLDILVERGSFLGACDVLQSVGYEPGSGGAGRSADFYAARHFHRVLTNPAGVTVELHWDLSRPNDYYRFDLERFHDRCRIVDLDGCRALVPSDADQLLHAACQMIQSGFADLRRILDAALLIGSGATGDPDLAARAARQGMTTALWMLLTTVESITGVRASPSLQQALAPSAPRRACIASLDVPDTALSLLARERSGYKTLVRLLGSPDLASLVATARRFLLPDRWALLDAGCKPRDVANPARRVLLTLQRWLSFAKLSGYQILRLAVHPFRTSRPDG